MFKFCDAELKYFVILEWTYSATIKKYLLRHISTLVYSCIRPDMTRSIME